MAATATAAAATAAAAVVAVATAMATYVGGDGRHNDVVDTNWR